MYYAKSTAAAHNIRKNGSRFASEAHQPLAELYIIVLASPRAHYGTPSMEARHLFTVQDSLNIILLRAVNPNEISVSPLSILCVIKRLIGAGKYHKPSVIKGEE